MNHKKKPRRCRCLALDPSLDSPIPRFSNSLGCNGTTAGSSLDCALQSHPLAVSLCPHYHSVGYGQSE
jgi:hypothetical protein